MKLASVLSAHFDNDVRARGASYYRLGAVRIKRGNATGVEAGVRGYLVKSDSDRDLLIAVETLAKHKPFFTPLATQAILNNLGGAAAEAEPADNRLTSREREILQLISEGNTAKQVASILGLSSKTVETHRSNLSRKLKIHDVTSLVRYAVRNQIIEP